MMLLACTLLYAERMERVFFSYDASNGLADNSAQTIKCTKTGRMVITTIGHVNFFDGAGFVHIDPTPENDFPLPKYFGHYHLYFDQHHHLWVKDKNKVTCVDLMKERFVTHVDSVIKSMGMNKDVEDMFGDGENTMWFMSKGKLYCPTREMTVPVGQNAELHDIDTYNNTLLQFFANGVVSVYDLSNGKHLYDASSLDHDNTRPFISSVTFRDGRFFYQIRNGEKDACLMRFDVHTREWKELMSLPYHLNNMVMHDGIIFVACEYGYWEYNPVSGEKKHQETMKLSNGRKLLTDVNTIAFDRQGGMWIGTEKRGLLYAKAFTSPFYAYSWDEPEATKYAEIIDKSLEWANSEPLGRHVNCKYVDSRGWTWTGLYTGLRLERPLMEPYTFTTKDGMMNEMVHSVIEDDYHDIWAATSYGICHLFVENNEVVRLESYFSSDNVPNESFVNRRAAKLTDGTILMQALDHVVTFNPHHFHTNDMSKMVLYPKLIRLTVNGHEIYPGMELDGRVILENAITRSWEFTVGYQQNSMSLTFSGLNFLRPTQTYYRYRIKAIKDKWKVLSYFNSDGQVDIQGLLHLPLIGLKPGRYEIELQVSMSPKEWPQEPFTWIINVEEPWWRTTGLYTLFGLVLATIFILNFYYYNKNLRLRMKVINDEAELQHRITSFALRCKTLESEVLTPFSLQEEGSTHQDPAFADIMTKVVPFVLQCKEHEVAFNMHQLCEVAGVDIKTFYEQLSLHLNESPRLLMLQLRLGKVARMLVETDKIKEAIAEELGFVSPNYMIATFFHLYRQTPDDYRNSMAR
jgi:AraC-like DNA-binding protein